MIHHVYACRTNLGDWLSAKGIQSLLAPAEVTEHLCNDPFVEATLEQLSKARPNDLVVIGGGGLFMDYFAPFWQGFREISERVPFCIWGAGYCDLKREHTHPPLALLSEIVERSRLCVVRDELTREYLSACDLPPAVPCPSMSVIETLPAGSERIVHAVNHDNIGHHVYAAMTDATKRFAVRRGRRYSEINNEVADGSEADLRSKLDLYASCDLVVSSRLHGCIIAAAMGRKVVAVSGDRKMESFMEAAGLGDWNLDLADVSMLGERLDAVASQPEATDFVAAARRNNREVAREVRTIAEDLGSQ